MSNKLILVVFLLFPAMSYAQWGSGTSLFPERDIYYAAVRAQQMAEANRIHEMQTWIEPEQRQEIAARIYGEKQARRMFKPRKKSFVHNKPKRERRPRFQWIEFNK